MLSNPNHIILQNVFLLNLKHKDTAVSIRKFRYIFILLTKKVQIWLQIVAYNSARFVPYRYI